MVPIELAVEHQLYEFVQLGLEQQFGECSQSFTTNAKPDWERVIVNEEHPTGVEPGHCSLCACE
jgi:hypothetical protein